MASLTQAAFETVPTSDAEARTLLAGAGLDASDLQDVPGAVLVALRRNGRVDGVVGLEVHGACALLRSLAVASECRGH